MAKGTQSAPRPARRDMTDERARSYNELVKAKAARSAVATAQSAKERAQLYNQLVEAKVAGSAVAKARRGRPPLPKGLGKRHPLGIRTTKQLREQLEQAAKSSGRSLAQEVEYRLERSFDQSQLTKALLEAQERISVQIEDMQAKIKAEMQREVADLRQTLQEIRDREITRAEEQKVREQRARDEQTRPVHLIPDPRIVRMVPGEPSPERPRGGRIVAVAPREPSPERHLKPLLKKLLENKR